jgi:hypothetical protein
MKSIINKFFIGSALLLTAGLVACTGDLDQLPKDPNTLTPDKFAEDPEGYISGALAKCYSSLAVSGQYGQNGSSDISGLDGGTSQWSRVNYIMEEFPTDVAFWIYQDSGVPEMVNDTWANNNGLIYGAYSRYYTHIAVCNDFIRMTRSLGEYGITPSDALQKDIEQYVLEARALRDLSYFYIIDWFGRAPIAWDDMAYGDRPEQAESREALYNKVVEDLEDVYANFPDSTPVYGRIGKDAVEALLCKYYLNAEVFTGTAAWDKCWSHAQNIISRHQGGGFQGSGLATDYLSLFCNNNNMFMPGGSLTAQNEILWGVPYDATNTRPWGGTMYLIAAMVKDAASADPTAEHGGFCNKTWYGLNASWGCLLTTEAFAKKFNFVNGESTDARVALWLTEKAGYSITNDNVREWANGYAPIKFTNVVCNADGTMPLFTDSETGLTRAGVQPVDNSNDCPDTDLPIIRLADVYLMAAEASLHGAGNQTDGLKYANYIRQRAGLAAWNAAEFSLDNLLDERGRELYHECVRRTDLIRYNKFTGTAYTWTLKGGVQAGGSLSDYRKLYPIPTNVMEAYGSSMVQNAGY